MGAGSSVNIERVQVVDDKIIRTNMSVIPVSIGVTQSNMYSVQRSEESIPEGLYEDLSILPFRDRNEVIYNNVYAMMNIESIRNKTNDGSTSQSNPNPSTNEYELIDVGQNGVYRVTGDGVRPIVDILHSMEHSGMHTQYNAIGGNGPTSYHLRNSPFVDVINPLFQTGERIYNMSNELNGSYQFQGDTRAVSQEFIKNLREVESADEDCSICLEELNSTDVPPYKYMLQQKTLIKIKENLHEREIVFDEEAPKRELLDKLWNDRENKNTHYSIKVLGCNHLFHLRCLREWLQKRDTCPVCRAKVYNDKPDC